MKTKNTMQKSGFIVMNIYWSLLAMIWYRNTIFKCLSGISYTQSRLILWGLLLLCVSTGTAAACKKKRNGISVMANVAIPYGIYALLTYYKLRRNFILAVIYAVCLISCAFLLLIMGRRITDRRKFRRIVKNRIKYAFNGVKYIFAGGMAVILVSLNLNLFFGSTYANAPVSTTATEPSANKRLEADYENVKPSLQPEVWNALSVKERLDALQTFANIERQCLGISNELNVGIKNMDETTLGYYSEDTHEIMINEDYIASGSSLELLNVICHEAYHSYQHRIVEVYAHAEEKNKNLKLFPTASSYEKEFRNYIQGEDDFCGYYEQDCEKDARAYAAYSVEHYHEKIESFLAGEDF